MQHTIEFLPIPTTILTMFQIDSTNCADTLQWITAIYTTVLLISIGIILQLSRSITAGEKDTEETPDVTNVSSDYTDIQEYARALNLPKLPAEYQVAGLTRIDVFGKLRSAMEAIMHPNTHDLAVLMDILGTEPTLQLEANPQMMMLLNDASRWISAALLVWSSCPNALMPTWSGHSYVTYVEEDTDSESGSEKDTTENHEEE